MARTKRIPERKRAKGWTAYVERWHEGKRVDPLVIIKADGEIAPSGLKPRTPTISHRCAF